MCYESNTYDQTSLSSNLLFQIAMPGGAAIAMESREV